MSNLRESAPLLDAYLSYFEKARTPFTIPGHKQKTSALDAGLGAIVDSDTPLYGGLDEIKLTNQTLRKAEALAAQLWGADYARWFYPCKSSSHLRTGSTRRQGCSFTNCT